MVEDTLNLSDISVAVEGVGLLQLPLEEDIIDKLIGVSVKDKTRELTVTNALDSYIIPESGIKVELKEDTLSRIVEIISGSLNIVNDNFSLEFNVRSMSIYGPGQFCGSHNGGETDNFTDVRMDVLLPCQCEGGDLYIKHGAQTHKCCSRGDSDTMRWTAYYTDCTRRVFEVKEGHRVVLSFNVAIEYLSEPEQPLDVDVSEYDVSLNTAVAQHMSQEDRLVVLLLHRYPEGTLDWHRIKGRDVAYARALLAVAKYQGLRPFLALAKCLETWETSGFHGPVRNGGSVEIHYWVDESGHKQEDRVSIDYKGMAKQVCTFRDNLWALGEPDKEVKLGWYGEGPAIREQWYHRACVVLLKTT